MNLTPLEQIAWRGLQARFDTLNAEQRQVVAAIAERLGLAPDAIGKTHGIDLQTWTVVPLESEAPA